MSPAAAVGAPLAAQVREALAAGSRRDASEQARVPGGGRPRRGRGRQPRGGGRRTRLWEKPGGNPLRRSSRHVSSESIGKHGGERSQSPLESATTVPGRVPDDPLCVTSRNPERARSRIEISRDSA